ncbi:MAG: hypothetical protein EXS15_05110 [Phycisphaerales bacterium]|nr:hypothetical protein [Phycisphaerales bacterium]
MTSRATSPGSHSLARQMGECLGHILKAVRTPVAIKDRGTPPLARGEITSAMMREEQFGSHLHRRIIIDQILPLDASSTVAARTTR